MSVNDENDATDDSGEDATETPPTHTHGDEDADDDEAGVLTTNPNLRLSAWATVAAFIILTTFYLLWAFLLFRGRTLPPYMNAVVYLGVTFALIWTFGKGTAATVSDLTERLPVSFGRS